MNLIAHEKGWSKKDLAEKNAAKKPLHAAN